MARDSLSFSPTRNWHCSRKAKTIRFPMQHPFTDLELEAYLEEALPPSEMAQVEAALRNDPSLLERLATINGGRDMALHSVGDVWKRHRISCASREVLGSYLLQTLPEEHAAYIRFHIETVGCRLCGANLEDLQRQQRETAEAMDHRRRRYFQSSAGYLRKPRQ